MQATTYFKVGAFLAGLSVVAGAFGAHSLENMVSSERLATFETGVTYQMYHAFGLMIVGWFGRDNLRNKLRFAGIAFLSGIVLFSGSLYVLVLTDTGWLGAITPLGGIAFIIGWVLLALEGLPHKNSA